MSIGEVSINVSPTTNELLTTLTQPLRRWHAILNSPLWFCLLLALGLRIWLIFRTHGFVDGDEALVGIQAQHILRGELLLYYYGQPYMGSLETYLIALCFAIFGSSTWAMRLVPLLLSPLLVWLTWKLAGTLADAARLSPAIRRWFMTIAALFASIPPLYDGIIELRAWGGHIEIYIITLWLLFSTLRLTQRWQAGASPRETALRWAGIGFLVGLGLWVYPLIITAILTSTIWIAGHCLRGILIRRKQVWLRLALVIIALPTFLVGFAPALYWGASHQWANILYLLSPSNSGSQASQQRFPNRLSILKATTVLYTKCVAPHVIGGALPNSPTVHSLLQASVGIVVVLTTVTLVALSLIRHSPSLVRIQQLALFPAIFGIGTGLIFCVSRISAAGLVFPCTRDEVGRYGAPLNLVLPFFFATIAISIYLYVQEKYGQLALTPSERKNLPQVGLPLFQRLPRLEPLKLVQSLLVTFLLIYLAFQTSTYLRAPQSYTFQSFACSYAPVNNEPIIAYMQQKHIQYAYASLWIGNAIVFKTHSQIIITDPRNFSGHDLVRLPAYAQAVRRANRPSILIFALHHDIHPKLLQVLDAKHVSYALARFPAELGLDVLVVTPNQTVSPRTADFLQASFYNC